MLTCLSTTTTDRHTPAHIYTTDMIGTYIPEERHKYRHTYQREAHTGTHQREAHIQVIIQAYISERGTHTTDRHTYWHIYYRYPHIQAHIPEERHTYRRHHTHTRDWCTFWQLAKSLNVTTTKLKVYISCWTPHSLYEHWKELRNK